MDRRRKDGVFETLGTAEPTPRGERSSTYFEAALDCVTLADAAGRVVEFKPAAERTSGYTRKGALGRKLAEPIVPPSLGELNSRLYAVHGDRRAEIVRAAS